jgi:hypothetical protein
MKCLTDYICEQKLSSDVWGIKHKILVSGSIKTAATWNKVRFNIPKELQDVLSLLLLEAESIRG